jgi:hypothetical protein
LSTGKSSLGEARRRSRCARTSPAKTGGKKGAKARGQNLPPEERSKLAKKAAAARWCNTTKPK